MYLARPVGLERIGADFSTALRRIECPAVSPGLAEASDPVHPECRTIPNAQAVAESNGPCRYACMLIGIGPQTPTGLPMGARPHDGPGVAPRRSNVASIRESEIGCTR